MSRSERWQKFYRIYCKFSGLMVGLVVVLTFLGDTGLGLRYQWLYSTARNISFALFAATVTGADLLLWLISLGVWFSRRQSAKLWHILGWGLAMLSVKFLNFMYYIALTGDIP